MFKIAAFLTLALLMTGCSAASLYRGAVAQQGAEASDQALESAEWAICSGIPVGAIMRRYNTDEKRAAYNTLCSNSLP